MMIYKYKDCLLDKIRLAEITDWIIQKININNITENHLCNLVYLMNISHFDKYNKYMFDYSENIVVSRLNNFKQKKPSLDISSELDKRLHQIFMENNMYDNEDAINTLVMRRKTQHDA